MAENTKAALDEKILECLALLKKLDNESGTLEAVSYLIRRPDPPLDIDKLVDKAMAEGDRVRPFSDALVLALKSLLDLVKVLEAEGRDFEVDDILAFIQSPTILTSKNVASALNTVAWQSSVSAIRDMSDIDTWLKNPDIISMSSTTIAHELEMELKRLRPLWDALRAKEESVSLNGDGGGRSWDRKRSAREYDQCRQVISILGRVLKRRLRAAGMASSLNTLYALVSEWKWADLPTAIREVMDAADEFAFNESGSVAGSPSPRAEGDSKPVVEGNNPEAPSKPPAPERSDAPDASGLVLSPLDLSAYRPAMKLVVDFPNIVPDLKELNQILTKHPEIRRYKPRDNRLSVHLVDWQKFVDTFHPTSDGWDENPQNNKIRADQIRKNREGK